MSCELARFTKCKVRAFLCLKRKGCVKPIILMILNMIDWGNLQEMLFRMKDWDEILRNNGLELLTTSVQCVKCGTETMVQDTLLSIPIDEIYGRRKRVENDINHYFSTFGGFFEIDVAAVLIGINADRKTERQQTLREKRLRLLGPRTFEDIIFLYNRQKGLL